VLLATLPESQREVTRDARDHGHEQLERGGSGPRRRAVSVKQKGSSGLEKLRAVFAGKWRANEA
jgi:hypothetical protein